LQRVAVAAYSTGHFKKKACASLFELSCEPCINILRSNIISKSEVDAILFSSCSSEQYTSSIMAEMLGLRPKICHRLDNLCNSGTNAIVSAFSYISSGICDSALVVGADTNESLGSKLAWDITRGAFNLPVHWAAIFAKAHMRRYGTKEEDIAMVSVKNHENAGKNPNALFSEAVTLDDVMNSRVIVEPIKLLECCSACAGSSAVLLLSEEKAKGIVETPIWIKGIGQQTNCASISKVMGDLEDIGTAKIAARQAFHMSNLFPKDVDVAEVHDAFSILEILAYEDLGFVERGRGGNFVTQKDIVINPRGGLLGCGHPIGTTGVAQVSEIASQLSGNAGSRQIQGCETGLIHNLAAAGSSATVMILTV